MISFFRIIKFAFQDIGRNIGLSFMTVLILVLMLLSVNTLFVIRYLTSQATASIKDQIDVSVYFSADANDGEVEEIKKYVESFPEVTEVTFYSRAEVLDQFRERHKQNPNIIASLDELEENPLGPTMVIKTRTPADYANIITALSVPEYQNIVEAKTFDDTQTAIQRIDTVTREVEKFSILLAGFFAIIAFLIIFNTIRVAIYTQRVEISIKKLVGATNWFVRGPYLVEALIFSVLSVVMTYGLVLLAARFLDPYISVVFGKNTFLTNYYESNILLLVSIQLGAVFLLTIISSMLAMRKHLRA